MKINCNIVHPSPLQSFRHPTTPLPSRFFLFQVLLPVNECKQSTSFNDDLIRSKSLVKNDCPVPGNGQQTMGLNKKK